MKKFFKIVNRAEEGLIVAMFAVMVGIIFIQVIMRKLNNSLYWSEESHLEGSEVQAHVTVYIN